MHIYTVLRHRDILDQLCRILLILDMVDVLDLINFNFGLIII